MTQSSLSEDIQEIVKGVRNVVAKGLAGTNISGNSSPKPVQPTESEIQLAVLSVLKDAARSGSQVVADIRLASAGTFQPTSSKVFPMLDKLVSEGLLQATIEGDAKMFTITKAGLKALKPKKNKPTDTPSDPETSSYKVTDGMRGMRGMMAGGMGSMSNMGQKYRDEVAVLKAGAKLAQVVTQVAQTGSKNQKQRVTAIIDDARRSLHEILAEKK